MIDDITVSFQEGLTIITGETGAGKSILLGALALVLGKRADSKVVRDPEKKCVVEATFFIKNYLLEEGFKENDLDYEDHTILRREILPSGKSRAFINDTPITLQQMQWLGAILIDVHSQHDTFQLTSEAYQLEVVDVLANNEAKVMQYQLNYVSYLENSERLTHLKEQQQQALKDQDYYTFLWNELAEAKLTNFDQESLETQVERLNNIEIIQASLQEVSQLLSEEQTGSLATIAQTRSVLQKIKNFSPEYQVLWQRINSLHIEAMDITDEVQTVSENIEADPQLLLELTAQLQQLYKLQQKHKVSSVVELIDLQNEFQEKLDGFSSLETSIISLQKQVQQQEEHIKKSAKEISESRKNVLPQLKNNLELFLRDLGLPNATFQFTLEHTSYFKKTGMDSLTLLFSANKGIALGAINKVASGGEMSRIMLAVKAVLANHKKLPTIVFDEIDTGVSGEIAHKMASILAQMSKNGQIISITHLPQIAAKGDVHKKVFKVEAEGTTKTYIKELQTEERIKEIAGMIGGSTITESAIAHAKQLLN